MSRKGLFVLLCLSCLSLARAQIRLPADSIAYDAQSGLYLRYERSAEGAPMSLRQAFTPKEYVEWRQADLRRRYALGHAAEVVRVPDFLRADTLSRLKPALKINLSGDVSLSLAHRTLTDDNPSVPETLRKRSYIDFKHSVNVSASAMYGEHLRMDVGYNTESKLLSESRNLRLTYTGHQHDLIKHLEVGDIAFLSANPLIQGVSPLLGIKSELGLGALSLRTFVSKREGSSRKMKIRAGRQVRPFEIKGSDYDKGRHFFLSEAFARRYDEALASVPLVQSDLYVEQIHVWVTSTRGRDRSLQTLEHIVATAALSVSESLPDNSSSEVYRSLSGRTLVEWKDEQASDRLGTALIEGARRLSEGEYRLNRRLGYISLHTPLADDEALAVSYEYTYQGQRYRVGDFSGYDTSEGVVVAALIATKAKEPSSPLWSLMMKNAYALPGVGRQLSAEDLRIEILCKDHAANTERQNITQGGYSSRSWGDLLGWDRVDSQGRSVSDGRFDFVPDVTVDPVLGVLFLPYRRPLDTVVQTVNGGTDYYPVYTSLYDDTQVSAQRQTEIDLFRFRGEYTTDGQTTIYLGSGEVSPGSVSLQTSARTLQEGIDYSVNYHSGELTLLSSSSLPTSEDIEVVIEERDRTSRRDKSFMGVEALYSLSPSLTLGASLLDYRERGVSDRIRWGEEPIHNRQWGIHLDYSKRSSRWTEWLNTLSLLSLDEPSSLDLRAAYARHATVASSHRDVVVEDFEQGTTAYDLLEPTAWLLSSLPLSAEGLPLDGDHRALVSWYSIDPRLLRDDEGSIMPDHLRRDPKARQGVFVREVSYTELFPRSDDRRLSERTLPVVNMSFYPRERGPYNLSTSSLDSEAYFSSPQEMWGGVMRPMTVRDFEAARIEYIEGWFMDPFVEAAGSGGDSMGGELYIDLGRLSEDILSDGVHTYENGLPSPSSPHRRTKAIPLGIAPADPVQVYAFDHSRGDTSQQDVGYNGLTSVDERSHPAYTAYLETIKAYGTLGRWGGERPAPYHPTLDPAGDDYHFYLGEYWDSIEADLLTRYKYINGLEGNSSLHLIQGQQSARTWSPDAEDLDGDMQMDRDESFFRYKIDLSKEALRVGQNYIVSQQRTRVNTPDGPKEVTWYKVRIPLVQYSSKVGRQPTLRDVRGLRLVLRGFRDTVHLRWAALRLVRSDWALLDVPLDSSQGRSSAEVALGTVGLEEDSGREPIPYVLPPGQDRERRQEVFDTALQDARALSLTIDRLSPRQSLGVYKSIRHDLRHYDKVKMYVHAEAPSDAPLALTDGMLEIFVRLGRDYTANYYEYRQPLYVTPHKKDSPHSYSPEEVWPQPNNIEIPLHLLPQLKGRRDAFVGHDPSQPFAEALAHSAGHSISIKGHPSLGDVTAIVIGIRSVVDHEVRGEVWVDELRVSGTQHSKGDALMAQMDLRLSDLAQVEVQGAFHGAGTGRIDQSIHHQQQSDRKAWDVRAALRLDKFFPTSWQAHIPLKYSYTLRRETPRFDPISDDVLYADRLSALSEDEGQHYALKVSTRETATVFSLEDVHFGIKDSIPKFWQPAHFRFAYRRESERRTSPDIASHYRRQAYAHLIYDFKAQPRGLSLYDRTTVYLYPQEWKLASRWRRTFDHREQRDRSVFASDGHTAQSLHHRFDWERSLRLGWRVTDVLRLSWDSATSAVIDEPFERQLSHQGTVDFRVMSDTIAHSILSLGRTHAYHSRGRLSAQLPQLKSKVLEGLKAGLTLDTDYRWDRAIATLRRSSGHTLRQTTSREGYLTYSWGQWLRHLSLRIRDSWGSHVPGYVPEAGKVLGISEGKYLSAPGLSYVLGWGSDESHLLRMVSSQWIVTDPSLRRTLSWYHHADRALSLTLSPLSGLQIDLHLSALHHRRSEVLPSLSEWMPRRMGSWSISTIGLADFWDDPLLHAAYESKLFGCFRQDLERRHSALVDNYQKVLSPLEGASLLPTLSKTHADVLSAAFVATYTKGRIDPTPSLLSALPDWGLRLDLAALVPWLQKYFSKVEILHRYLGRLEVNAYQYRTGWTPLSDSDRLGRIDSGDGIARLGAEVEVQSMTQRDDLSPCVGLEVATRHGLSVDVRYNKVRELSLLLQSARLLEQYRDEVVAGLRYRLSVPSLLALFSSRKVSPSTLSAQCSFSLGENYVVSRDLSRYLSQATRGVKSLTTRLSLDYALTTSLSLRGFYDLDRRTPIVSVHTYPYRSEAYGVMLRLSLRPSW